MTTQQPVPVGGQLTFALPANGADLPVFIIPPDTSSFTVSATSSVPAQVEIQGSAAGFDVFGDLAAAQGGNLVSMATVQESNGSISKGIWFGAIDEIGPFSDAGATPGTTTMTATMRANAFDPAVTSSTDDPFRIAVDPTGDGFGTPVLIPPGGTGTIQRDDHPAGQQGRRRQRSPQPGDAVDPPTGFTGLPQVTTGETISTLPYTYKIG